VVALEKKQLNAKVWNVLKLATLVLIMSLKCNSESKCRNVGDFEYEDTEPEILCKDMSALRVDHGGDNDIWCRYDIHSGWTPAACCR
jgi:hypothetical protein